MKDAAMEEWVEAKPPLIAMHELSLAKDIVDIVQQYIPPGANANGMSVHVTVGTAAGVVPDSLEFCFSAIIVGTSLQGASLYIKRVPLANECNSCRCAFESEMSLCPVCGGNDTRILAGTELQVDSIELVDDQPEAV